MAAELLELSLQEVFSQVLNHVGLLQELPGVEKVLARSFFVQTKS
jgi:hypothetical protein